MAVLFLNVLFDVSLVAAQIKDEQAKEKQIHDKEIVMVEGKLFTTRKNPIALPVPAEEDGFQFVVYGDRTGGEPSGLKYLRQAVSDTNLLDPDFVMTVGDMIQGYNRPDEWIPQMKEFKEIMSGLQMNWMPVAGNHDIYWDFRDQNRPNTHHEENYEKHFGPLWYSFVHKEHGFIVLYSDEGNPESGEKAFREPELQNVSVEQMDFLRQTLKKMDNCKQIFVFLHHPRWLGGGYEGCNWPEVHKMLNAAGNVAAVFAGHIHHMTYHGPVDGIEYYTLGATGGHLAMDAPELGYLHHYNVVTVRDDKFAVATYPVGAVIDPKDFKSEFLEDVDVVRQMLPERAGDKLGINVQGGVSNEYLIRIPNPGKFPIDVTIAPELVGGWRALPDHEHVVVPPGKTAGMKFHFHRSGSENEEQWDDYSNPRFMLSVDYLHENARVRLPEKYFDAHVSILGDMKGAFDSSADHCLQMRGIQSRRTRRRQRRFANDSVKIESGELKIAQGPFSIEAWVCPTDLDGSRAVVAKSQSSEYALFLHDGRPQFDVHLDGKYVSPKATEVAKPNQWMHIAGVYDGKQAKLFVDGKLIQSLDASGARTENQLPLYVGADPDGNGNPNREFAGKLDEVRISTGARYVSEFEPTEKHQTDDQTLLLLHCDKAVGPFLRDDSKGAATVLRVGQTAIVEKE